VVLLKMHPVYANDQTHRPLLNKIKPLRICNPRWNQLIWTLICKMQYFYTLTVEKLDKIYSHYTRFIYRMLYICRNNSASNLLKAGYLDEQEMVSNF
jgi:hypothetical protein